METQEDTIKKAFDANKKRLAKEGWIDPVNNTLQEKVYSCDICGIQGNCYFEQNDTHGYCDSKVCKETASELNLFEFEETYG